MARVTRKTSTKAQTSYGIRTAGKVGYPGKVVKGPARGGATKRKSR